MRDIQTPVLSADDAESPRLNRRQAAKVRTRQKVLDAARTLFSERGYDAATIRDIAKAAGMSTGAVFANFQDKAELFETVFADQLEQSHQTFRNGAGRDGAVSDRLTGALTAGYHRALGQLPLTQAMIARSWFQPTEADSRTRAFIKPQVDMIADLLKAGVASGELRQDVDVALIARMIWNAYLSNFHGAAYAGWDVDQLGDQIERQIKVILAGQLAR